MASLPLSQHTASLCLCSLPCAAVDVSNAAGIAQSVAIRQQAALDKVLCAGHFFTACVLTQLTTRPVLLSAAFCAGAVLLVFSSLLLMLLCQSHFVRYRRLVMWSNLLTISIMVRPQQGRPH